MQSIYVFLLLCTPLGFAKLFPNTATEIKKLDTYVPVPTTTPVPGFTPLPFPRHVDFPQPLKSGMQAAPSHSPSTSTATRASKGKNRHHRLSHHEYPVPKRPELEPQRKIERRNYPSEEQQIADNNWCYKRFDHPEHNRWCQYIPVAMEPPLWFRRALPHDPRRPHWSELTEMNMEDGRDYCEPFLGPPGCKEFHNAPHTPLAELTERKLRGRVSDKNISPEEQDYDDTRWCNEHEDKKWCQCFEYPATVRNCYRRAIPLDESGRQPWTILNNVDAKTADIICTAKPEREGCKAFKAAPHHPLSINVKRQVDSEDVELASVDESEDGKPYSLNESNGKRLVKRTPLDIFRPREGYVHLPDGDNDQEDHEFSFDLPNVLGKVGDGSRLFHEGPGLQMPNEYRAKYDASLKKNSEKN